MGAKAASQGKPKEPVTADASPLDTAQLAALYDETLHDPKTIRRWARGETVRPAIAKNLTRAAHRRGIKLKDGAS